MLVFELQDSVKRCRLYIISGLPISSDMRVTHLSQALVDLGYRVLGCSLVGG